MKKNLLLVLSIMTLLGGMLLLAYELEEEAKKRKKYNKRIIDVINSELLWMEESKP